LLAEDPAHVKLEISAILTTQRESGKWTRVYQ
jgi:hypothetical protein